MKEFEVPYRHNQAEMWITVLPTAEAGANGAKLIYNGIPAF